MPSCYVEPQYVASTKDLRKSSVLFCAPEAIDTGNWRDVIASPEISTKIVAVVVDEALYLSKLSSSFLVAFMQCRINCKSRDFRPSCGHLHEIRAIIPKGTPLLACSATSARRSYKV